MQSTQKQVGAGTCSQRKNGLVLVHAVNAKPGHAVDAKPGCTVDVYTPKAFVKSFDAEC